MNLTEELDKYFIERKWCQVLNLLHTASFTNQQAVIDFINSKFPDLITKCHTPSFVKILSVITDINPNPLLLQKVIKYFDSIEYKTKEQEESSLVVHLDYDIVNFKNNNKVYDYLQNWIPDSAKERFFLLLFLYFNDSKDFSQAYKFLQKYLEKLDKKKEDFYEKRKKEFGIKLAEVALKAEDVFSFDDILPKLENSELKNLLMAYNSGNIKFVMESNHPFPKEKVLLIALVKLTVYRRSISLEEVSSSLKLSNQEVLFLVFKSLGKKLLTGYYDGKKKEIFLYKSINKAINDEEIREMKNKFTEWRRKVKKEIESI